MYGLLVQLEIEADRTEDAIGFLTGVAVPMISQGDGFEGPGGCRFGLPQARRGERRSQSAMTAGRKEGIATMCP